ncbi:RNA polymerase sigma factor [Myxococcus sp. CA051A]|uniref:RNA polymerase sigma factor n=1 Tax=Myxococcus TaxID=32 RepID=UPI00157AA4A5|nr:MULTISPECIES: RNA polymerase sigma factor [Myxococcus]NTX03181.1 RNA polymerase sigma factor [Myxococcus sp. CA040A]NTX11596.1 RNA polymerase sigma factor [Myxococcus sp. CA056]NTX55954.1 RNA polymerase sigma factor [Myxococcus sp. CA039A]NTX60866.1 RNA polymerase sigma factor [Myxococcus sp. CA051A]
MTSTGREAIGRARPGADPRIQAAIQGRREAAESLLMELLPRVRNLVRYLVHGDGEVEDIAQEALIALLRGLSTYRGEGQFQSWVDRVVARTTFAWLKRARGNEARRVDESAELMAVPSEDAPPDEYVHRRRMVMLLDRIPDEQRHAMVLHHVLGMSVPEVSDELGIPFETIRSRLRLGRAALRALATEDGGVPDGGAE